MSILHVFPLQIHVLFFMNADSLSRFSTWRIRSREQAKSECDWLVMSSVFVTSQSSCFFLCSREQIRLVENRLYSCPDKTERYESISLLHSFAFVHMNSET